MEPNGEKLKPAFAILGTLTFCLTFGGTSLFTFNLFIHVFTNFECIFYLVTVNGFQRWPQSGFNFPNGQGPVGSFYIILSFVFISNIIDALACDKLTF